MALFDGYICLSKSLIISENYLNVPINPMGTYGNIINKKSLDDWQFFTMNFSDLCTPEIMKKRGRTLASFEELLTFKLFRNGADNLRCKLICLKI